MKTIAIRAAACAAAALLFAGPVAAQQIDSPYRFIDTNQFLNIFAGYVATSEGPLKTGPQSAPVLGARWAMRVSGPLALGAEVSYTPTSRTVRDTVFLAADSLFREVGEADMHIVSVMGNARLNVTGQRTWKGLQPYGVLGVGVAIDLAGSAPADTAAAVNARVDFGTSFAGQFGAGVEWFASPRVSGRFDVRNLLWRQSVPEAFRLTAAGRTIERSAWEQNLQLSAGLSFHF